MNKARIRAPELPANLEWLNTERPLKLADLRGKVVLLDFWTYGCINCMHILPDLRYLESKFPDGLAVIGIHSPKFPNERQGQQVLKAINRLHIQHPVVNDPELKLREQYRVKAWPTIIYIDPEGYIVGVMRGEGKWKKLEKAIARDLEQTENAGRRNCERLPMASVREPAGELRFPGKLLATEGRLYISDSGRNRILETDHGGRIRRIFGSGSPGLVDGQGEFASFNNPQGIIRVGDDLYVADAGNHAIRRLRLDSGDVETAAGTGEQAQMDADQFGHTTTKALNSPWDLTYRDGALFIAMAGQHQIWQFPLSSRKPTLLAGSGREDLVDGPARSACFAQPSGLAAFNDHLFVADAENSGIRVIRMQQNSVATVVGQGLFECGDREGIGRDARLQHPLAVVADPVREVLWVADTYNSKLKTIAFRDNRVRDFPIDVPLNEPGGLSVAGDLLFIANTNAHEIVRLDIKTGSARTLEINEAE